MTSADRIIATVCRLAHVEPRALRGRSKKGEITSARAAAAYLLRYRCGLSTPAVGELLRRDHSTIVDSCQQTRRMLESESLPPVHSRRVALVRAATVELDALDRDGLLDRDKWAEQIESAGRTLVRLARRIDDHDAETIARVVHHGSKLADALARVHVDGRPRKRVDSKEPRDDANRPGL